MGTQEAQPQPVPNGHLDPEVFALLRLTMTPGLGPVLIRRLVQRYAVPSKVCECSAAELERVDGIGPGKSKTIVEGLKASGELAQREWAQCQNLGVTLHSCFLPHYPVLLAPLADAPVLLYVRGSLDEVRDRFGVAIVGSRSCTSYGIEQSKRFGRTLAGAGLTVVSGGATGIDTAAHEGALDALGRTVAVLGCGLARVYPPQNEKLFERIVQTGGALISELPLMTPPAKENFPSRNRIISGMSLGVVVIEAARGSGALITAKVAAEEHGREVLVVPGRVDSSSSAGSLDLLKEGGALLITEPGDVIHALESPARHAAIGTHGERFNTFAQHASPDRDASSLFGESQPAKQATTRLPASESQRAILNALDEPGTIDDLCAKTGMDAGKLRGELTMLEIQKRVSRRGAVFTRV
ncbi:MAG: DNA-processing protein DprA [Phycisphaerales bacterium]